MRQKKVFMFNIIILISLIINVSIYLDNSINNQIYNNSNEIRSCSFPNLIMEWHIEWGNTNRDVAKNRSKIIYRLLSGKGFCKN
ncbi:MAG: hypothetical protein ACTSPY_17125 [Candidatus Helarchaeota archaeon]